jgi:hypothetical protein
MCAAMDGTTPQTGRRSDDDVKSSSNSFNGLSQTRLVSDRSVLQSDRMEQHTIFNFQTETSLLENSNKLFLCHTHTEAQHSSTTEAHLQPCVHLHEEELLGIHIHDKLHSACRLIPHSLRSTHCSFTDFCVELCRQPYEKQHSRRIHKRNKQQQQNQLDYSASSWLQHPACNSQDQQ